MVYNPAIPGQTDWLSNSQAQVQTNFTALDTIFGVDHVTYSAVTNNGLHSKITFSNVTADPALGAIPYPEALLYTKHQGIAPNQTTELFFSTENQNGATKAISQLTGLPSSITANGYITLAGGLILQWGGAVCNVAGTPIAFPKTFPNAVFSLTLSPVANQKRGIAENTLNTTGFVCYTENNGTQVYWMAIGN